MVGPLIEMGALAALDLADTTIVRHACLITRRDHRLSPAHRLMEEIIFEAERTYGIVPGNSALSFG